MGSGSASRLRRAPSEALVMAHRRPRDTALAKLHQLFVSSRRDYHERRVELLEDVAVVIRHQPRELANVVRDPVEVDRGLVLDRDGLVRRA